eukprot:TRINITY_DN6561_c0_g2_i1.p1 TRINITY_DN6561_c0_g2~~TRINITY_DN6561_c0_g2_i1.p1  ORF type:complete len:135 (-),score=11.57 TRINITY_DN6561_c0_g2_i1:121-525(-)
MYCDDAGKNQVLLAVLQPKQRAALASDVGWWHLVPLGEELSGSELNLCHFAQPTNLHPNPQEQQSFQKDLQAVCPLASLWSPNRGLRGLCGGCSSIYRLCPVGLTAAKMVSLGAASLHAHRFLGGRSGQQFNQF